MPSPRVLVSAVCIAAAVVLTGPRTWVMLRHRTGWALIHEVVVTPLADGRARLSVLYDVPTGTRVGRTGEYQGGTTWLAWGQDGGSFALAEDPVLPLAEARERADRLRASIGGERRHLHRVYYRANDPSGTAFIQIDEARLTAYHLGMVCVLLSLILCLRFPRRRPG
jgi:hypothetical protein